MHVPSLTGILFLLLIGLLLFGPSKLPQLGRAVGSTLKEFKLASQGILGDDAPKPIEEKSQMKQSEQELRLQIEKEIRAQMDKESREKQEQVKPV